MEFTFGEQINILLMRKKMTIADLAAILNEKYEQNITQDALTLAFENDNFRELEMQQIASALGCRVRIELEDDGVDYSAPKRAKKDYSSLFRSPAQSSAQNAPFDEDSDSLYDDSDASGSLFSDAEGFDADPDFDLETPRGASRLRGAKSDSIGGPAKKSRPKRPASRTHQLLMNFTPSAKIETNEDDTAEVSGEINPYTGMEYLNNTVRRVADKPGMVEVYDASEHSWIETDEAEFREFQARKQELLGADYEPPLWI